MHTETLEYFDDDTRLLGYLASPAGSESCPGILIAHTWEGCNSFVKDKAEKLAGMGFTALALDMYGDGKIGDGPGECEAMMKEFTSDRRKLARRINVALEALKAHPRSEEGRTMAMGYCFGGLCVLDLARSGADLCGVASFHGLLHGHELETPPIKAKILVMHGYDDPMVPPDMLADFQQEMQVSGADWQVHSYGNTVHAFTNRDANMPDFGAVYSPAADRRSWQSLVNFLEELFQS